MIKKLFGGKKQESAEDRYTIDDLIVLERYDEASSQLLDRIKLYPNDLHAHLKLAEVYIGLKQLSKAVDEYVYVAEEYASDGFFDKGIALLSKVQKLLPMDDTLPLKIEKIRQAKKLERVRELAMEGLREGMGKDEKAGSSALELQGLWGGIQRCSLVRRLEGEQLKKLFSVMTLITVEGGKTIAQKDSRKEELFIVVGGTMEAMGPLPNGKLTQLRTFSAGDLVGERAILERRAWPALYRAVDNVKLLLLTREGLEKNLQGNPDPRGFLEALREQQQDMHVARTLNKLWE